MLAALVALACGLLAPPLLHAQNFTDSQAVSASLDPEEDAPHPTDLLLSMVLAEDHPEGGTICVGYAHALGKKRNRGKVDTVVRAYRPSPRSLRGDLVFELDLGRTKVRDAQTLVCEDIDVVLESGDWLDAELRFAGRPPIRAAMGESSGVRMSIRQGVP